MLSLILPLKHTVKSAAKMILWKLLQIRWICLILSMASLACTPNCPFLSLHCTAMPRKNFCLKMPSSCSFSDFLSYYFPPLIVFQPLCWLLTFNHAKHVLSLRHLYPQFPLTRTYPQMWRRKHFLQLSDQILTHKWDYFWTYYGITPSSPISISYCISLLQINFIVLTTIFPT